MLRQYREYASPVPSKSFPFGHWPTAQLPTSLYSPLPQQLDKIHHKNTTDCPRETHSHNFPHISTWLQQVNGILPSLLHTTAIWKCLVRRGRPDMRTTRETSNGITSLRPNVRNRGSSTVRFGFWGYLRTLISIQAWSPYQQQGYRRCTRREQSWQHTHTHNRPQLHYKYMDLTHRKYISYKHTRMAIHECQCKKWLKTVHTSSFILIRCI